MELLGELRVGGEPLVQRHEQHQIVHHPDGEEEDGYLAEPHLGAHQRADEVADDGEVVGRGGHLGQPAVAAGHPLAVDLEVEEQDGRHEDVPDDVVDVRHRVRHALDQEEAGDPRREEEVDADRVVELAPHRLEVEDDLVEVDGDERHERRGDPPERVVHGGAHVQERRRRLQLQRLPQHGLAAHAQAHPERVDREPEQERPRLVLRERRHLRRSERLQLGPFQRREARSSGPRWGPRRRRRRSPPRRLSCWSWSRRRARCPRPRRGGWTAAAPGGRRRS